MLPETVKDNDRYQFKCSDRDDLFFILLVDSEEMDGQTPVVPLWLLACGTEESRDAVSLWLSVRRGLWQDWGSLAKAVGYEAFAPIIAQLMEQQPPGHFQATAVNRLDDERQIAFGMLLATSDGLRVEPVYVHTFGSSERRQCFFTWFHKGKNHLKAEDLVRIAMDKGTGALSTKLEQIAAKQAGYRPKRKAA